MQEQLRQFSTVLTAADQGNRSAPQAETDQYIPYDRLKVMTEDQQMERITKSGHNKQARLAIRDPRQQFDGHEAHDADRAQPESLIGARPTSGVQTNAEKRQNEECYQEVVGVRRLPAGDPDQRSTE